LQGKQLLQTSKLSLLLRYKRLLGVVLFLGALLAIFELSGLRDHFSLEFLQRRIHDNEFTGLAIFVLLFSLGNLIQIPGWIFLAAAVLTLGELMGGIATFVAASVSCGVTFFVIRAVGGDVLRRLNNRVANRIFHQLDSRPIATVALLRIFFQTAPALNYALALSGLKFRQYLTGTLLGLPLPIMLYCIFFDSLAKGLRIN
jgi:uncharacterized membrane protein YdjX (TVP38/TMEM64 family)